jgi:iron complex outermembrane receptor protein
MAQNTFARHDPGSDRYHDPTQPTQGHIDTTNHHPAKKLPLKGRLSQMRRNRIVHMRLAAPQFAVAQAAPAAADEPAAEEVIIVTGTRRVSRSAADTPAPVDIIGGAEIAKQGESDTSNLIRNLVPSFNVNTQAINDASSIVRPVNLRGLAPDQTLVLVNGKRRHRAAVINFLGGGVSDGAQGPDISSIPSIALKQVEVLRDGAAAQYGSDAIAGVMNFILRV